MTGKIKVFPSVFEGRHIEEHDAEGTVGEWLSAKYPAYNPEEKQLFILKIDGKEIPHTEWMKARITDDTCLYFAPQATYLPYIYYAVMIAAVIYFATMSTALPKSKGSRSGNEITSANASANTVRLGDVIPEVAGRYRRYPDYLLPIHRYYQNKREQYARMLLCIGKGEYDIPANKIKIGDTTMASLGDDAEYTIYGPSESLASELCAEWWHSAVEVGSPTTGGAGLQIKATYDVPRNPTSTAYVFDGFYVEIPLGAGQYPADWVVGMQVKIENFKVYTVYNDSFLAVIQLPAGQDFTELQPFVGMVIEITGENAGYYKIGSYTPYVASPLQLAEITLTYDNGDPVSALTIGERLMSIGYRGQLYEINDISTVAMGVDRLTNLGAQESSWNGFDYYETHDATVELSGANVEGDWCGPFSACPNGQETDTVEVDFLFSDGLVKFSEKGYSDDYSVTVELQWRESGSSDSWNLETFVYTEQTLDQLAFTEQVAISPACNPEVRVRRIGADSNKTTIRDTVTWAGLRALLPAPTSYDDVTIIAVKIRGDSRISGQSENKINLEVTRKIPIRSGGSWTANTATRSIAAFAAYIAKDIGYTDAQIDMDELDRLDAIWTGRDDYYDFVCDDAPVRDQINQCLRAGFAELTVDHGKIRFVRDEERTVFDQLYTPQNQTTQLQRKFTAVTPNDKDGVDVEYMDATTWSMQTVQCRLPGDNGYRVQKLQLDGVTDIDRAWRIGMRARRDMRYRRWSYEWKTELDGLCSRYLSYCAVSDDVPGYGKSAIVLSAVEDSAGTMLTLSEPMDISGSSIIAMRNQDGSLDGPYTATAGATDYEVYAVDAHAPDFIDGQEPPHAVVGTTEKWSFPVLIKNIKPDNYDSVSMTAINYAHEVYEDDDGTADRYGVPNWNSVILLLDFNDYVGTTDFRCSRTRREFTTVGTVATTNANSDSGYNSVQISGTTNYIYAAPDPTFRTGGTGNYTVEATVRIPGAGTYPIFDTCELYDSGRGGRYYGFIFYIENGVPKVFLANTAISFGNAVPYADWSDLIYTHEEVGINQYELNVIIDGVAGTPYVYTSANWNWDTSNIIYYQDGINIGVVANVPDAGLTTGYQLRKLMITDNKIVSASSRIPRNPAPFKRY